MNQKNPVLNEHFERLKELVPEVYSRRSFTQNEPEVNVLFEMLKKSLGLIEAVYLQNPDHFSAARIEEYGQIITKLEDLGYQYEGNEALLEKAASSMIMSAKKPMQKAKGARKRHGDQKKAM